MSRPSNRALQQLAADSAGELDGICRELASGTLQRIAEAEGGAPAMRFDRAAVATGGGARSDPTTAGALRGPELASLNRAEIARLLVTLRAHIDSLARLVSLYPPPHAAGAGDRLALSRVNARIEPGCGSCARLSGALGPRWEPVHPQLAEPTYAGGRLPQPMWLCRWCYDALLAWGRLPSVKELTRHHAGQRVPWPTDIPRPS
jgi:hypothetical protein